MNTPSIIRSLAVLAGIALLAPVPVFADDAAEGEGAAAPPPQAAQPETPEVSDAQLSDFVDSYVEVQKIRERYQAPLSQAENPAEAEAIQQRATSEMVSAIEDSGLDVDDYNLIAAVIAQNPEVGARFQSKLEKRQEGS